ncbi:transporter [Pedobacter ginsengisoli]|uniref:Transporter n=1 Tax=Pedobacter ginsengisoli TaxID=363852 RepID=A0A2D1UA17_9SPHI|nr:DUF6691 family protein [Pedobacter ginsengisoli]ATP58440.1 transporter [Pedobacter ginsengisoli]
MIKSVKFILAGILFGIIMSKSEAISWYRIQEMFRFQSFHMFGIMGTALLTGIIAVWLMKKMKARDVEGKPVSFTDKEKTWRRYLIGGTIFGLGWALTGACPGPVFVLLGQGYLVMIVVIIGSLLGTFVYGLLKNRLPH